MTVTPAPLTDDDRLKFLWDAIKRIDFYINSINTKGALLITFNVASVAYVISKWDWLLPIDGHPCTVLLSKALLIVGTIATLVSVAFTLKVVFPFLESGHQNGSSLLYFGDISKMQDSDTYKARLYSADMSVLVDELASQVVILSKGAARKFNLLSWAIRMLIFVQLPCFALVLIIWAIS